MVNPAYVILVSGKAKPTFIVFGTSKNGALQRAKQLGLKHKKVIFSVARLDDEDFDVTKNFDRSLSGSKYASN